ncbi:UbiA family prenyltransferase [Prauserella endophytica]|uniref:4-hydroxybenzoate polyprenyltransferase n=1 Tax=Prauserella endophytica TaxID=1592324 RepID=A0ABY2S839_9PSEU|nr:UbiA family prenyltransferase [Prauserella endophytica]TKG71841.1 hypothetical protein FCN18_10135 [Prauserella endophytica]
MSRLTSPLWRDVVTIHRLEYTLPVAYFCYAALGACFAPAGDGSWPWGPALLAVLANLLLIVGPLALNVAVDSRTDERHQEKRYLAAAASGFGRSRAVRWSLAELGVGLVLSTTVALWTGSWLVAAAATAIIVLQAAYNLEPVRLKRRGFAGPTAFGIASVGLPFLLSYGAVTSSVDITAWLLASGMGVLAVGRTVWWSLPDRMADAATDISAPAVRYGLRRTVALTCVILAAGLALLVAGLWWRYGPVWAVLGSAAHGVFLACVATLAASTSDTMRPSARRMLKRSLPLVTIAELALVVTALANR